MADPSDGNIVGGASIAITGNNDQLKAKLTESRSAVEAYDRDTTRLMSHAGKSVEDMAKTGGAALTGLAGNLASAQKAQADMMAQVEKFSSTGSKAASTTSMLTKATGDYEAVIRSSNAARKAGEITWDAHNANLREASKNYQALVTSIPSVANAAAKAESEMAKLAAGSKAASAQLFFQDVTGQNKGSALNSGASFSALDDMAKTEIAAKKLAEAEHGLTTGTMSTSRAMREFIVILRELGRGDFSRMAGSVTILTQALFGSTAAVIGTTLAAGALIGVVAGLEYELHEGAKDADDFTNSMKATGEQAGITEGQFFTSAAGIAEANHKSAASVRELELQIVRTGKVSGDNVALMTQVAEESARAFGDKPQDELKKYAALTGDTTSAVIEINKQTHAFNAEQVRAIELLQISGDEQGAVAMALKIANGQIKDQTENLGWLEKAWRAAGQATDEYIEEIRALGRTMGPGEEISKLQDLLKQGDSANPTEIAFLGGKDAIKQRIADLQKVDDAQKRVAVTKAADDAAQQARIDRDHKYAKVQTDLDKAQIDLVASTKDLSAARAKGDVEGAKSAQADIDGEKRAIAAAQKKIDGPTNRRAETLAREADAERVSAEMGWKQVEAYDAGSVAMEEAEIRRKAYTDATKKGTDTEAEYQRQSAIWVAQTAIDGANQASALKEQVALQENANKQVAAGTYTREEADQQAQEHVAIQKLTISAAMLDVQISQNQVLADKAKGAEKQRLINLISDENHQLADTKDLQGKIAVLMDEQFSAQQVANIQSATQAQKDQNDELELQTKLLMATNRERLTALALAQAARDNRNLDLTDPAQAAAAKSHTDELLRGANDQASAQYATMGSAYKNQQAGNQMGDAAAASAQNYNPKGMFGVSANTAAQYQAANDRVDELEREKVFDQDSVKNHEDAERAKAELDRQYHAERLKGYSDFFGGIASLTDSSNKELHALGKAAAIAQASIDGYVAIQKAWASAPWPFNIPAVAVASAETFANVEKIASLATGGPVSGAGGPTDDKVPAWLSNGEYVVNAAATARNRGLLDKINSGIDARPSANWTANDNSGPSSMAGVVIHQHFAQRPDKAMLQQSNRQLVGQLNDLLIRNQARG